jgi:hypothetical protein
VVLDTVHGQHVIDMTALEGSKAVIEKLEEIADGMKNGFVDTGFMEGATYPDGTPVASVAFWDEYGHGGKFPSPPRPYFRTMIAKESPTWPQKMAALTKAHDYDGQAVLGMMGEDIVGALQQSITELQAPALSPTTLMLRSKFGNNPQNIKASDVLAAQKDVADGKSSSGASAKPLVWTGHMLNSVAYKVS